MHAPPAWPLPLYQLLAQLHHSLLTQSILLLARREPGAQLRGKVFPIRRFPGLCLRLDQPLLSQPIPLSLSAQPLTLPLRQLLPQAPL
jgi:hypothetical protein